MSVRKFEELRVPKEPVWGSWGWRKWELPPFLAQLTIEQEYDS
jgi:hypothetical protein